MIFETIVIKSVKNTSRFVIDNIYIYFFKKKEIYPTSKIINSPSCGDFLEELDLLQSNAT